MQADCDQSDANTTLEHDFADAKIEENVTLALHEAAAKNDVHQLIKRISLPQSQEVDKGLVNQKNSKNQSALHVAAIKNIDQSHFDLIEILLNNGANPNAKDYAGCTPLLYLFKKDCNLEIWKLFLRFKADFTVLGHNKFSLLFLAIEHAANNNRLDVVKFLVEEAGLDVSHRAENGMTCLHFAALCNEYESHYDVLEYLLEVKPDLINALNDYEWTPLYCLVRNGGNLRVVDLFLKYNADVYAINDYGHNVLFAFNYYHSDVQVLDEFFNHFDLDVNQQDLEKKTPLHYILSYYDTGPINIKVAKCLLRNGANINAPNSDGATPMINAVRENRATMDQWFLNHLDYFNFLIEQVDFSKVFNGIHIFYYHNQPKDYKYDDPYDDDDDYRNSKYIWKWVLEHLAKLKFLNIAIHPIVLEFIEENTEFKDYFKKCTVELEAMKNSKLPNSWITFFNLLVDGRRKLKNYAANEDLIEDYKNNDWLEMFPIYGALIEKNVKKGLKRRELFDKSAFLLSDCLPILKPNHIIVKDVLDIILSKKILSKFCE